MNAYARDAVVENYGHLIDKLELPDKDDQHVLAAAIHSKSDLIVTFNLRDFPESTLSDCRIKAVHPDEFILKLIAGDADSVYLAARRQWKSLRNPPKPLPEFLDILESNGLKQTVEQLRSMFEKEPQ